MKTILLLVWHVSEVLHQQLRDNSQVGTHSEFQVTNRNYMVASKLQGHR